MHLLEILLIKAVEMEASDLHIKTDVIPVLRINGELKRIGEKVISAEEIRMMTVEILKDRIAEYDLCGECDTAYELKGIGRFRINIFKERGNDTFAVRIIKNNIPSLDELCFSHLIKEFTKEDRGLILVTGPTGSGKSTTLASMIKEINETRSCHIITLEDPIEYVHEDRKSLISQREIGKDTKGYEEGLYVALREDPDIILVGEMRSVNAIKIAITAAETGHLVFSTLHTLGSCETIDRIINVFPKEEQEEIKIQLSLVLKGVICQKLIKRKDKKGRVAAFEIMKTVPSIKNLIREGKTFQIPALIQTGKKYGMITMDRSLAALYRKGYIDREEALINCSDKNILEKNIFD